MIGDRHISFVHDLAEVFRNAPSEGLQFDKSLCGAWYDGLLELAVDMERGRAAARAHPAEIAPADAVVALTADGRIVTHTRFMRPVPIRPAFCDGRGGGDAA